MDRAASRFEGVAGRDPARLARDRNSPTGYPQGDSGAAARISAGDRPAVQLLAPPLQGARCLPVHGRQATPSRPPPAVPRPSSSGTTGEATRAERAGVTSQAVSIVLAWPCRQNSLTCSTGPSVDGHTQRETTSAATSQPGSGQATIWFMPAVWPLGRLGR